MSLTSYRTAPPRVTEFSLRSDPGNSLYKSGPETTSRPARPDGPRKVHRQPAEPRSTLRAERENLKEALLSFPKIRGQHNCDRFGRPGSDLLSRTLRHSTIDAGGLNDRVRNGIGWGTPAKTTRSAKPTAITTTIVQSEMIFYLSSTDSFSDIWKTELYGATCSSPHMGLKSVQAYRAISTGKLRSSRTFHTRPIDVIVYHGSQRNLVLRWVSRLDAFSGYPVRT
jgi:hypothetical protein